MAEKDTLISKKTGCHGIQSQQTHTGWESTPWDGDKMTSHICIVIYSALITSPLTLSQGLD